MLALLTLDLSRLWACLNWVRHSIYAPWTLFFFLIIGFAQTGIGWISGKLAVMALPSGVCSPKKKRWYRKLVELLAFLLLPSTMFIGVANDKNQRDADYKAAKAQESEEATHHQLDELGFHARHSDEATQRLLGSFDPTKLTPNQRIRYKEAQKASAEVVEAIPLKAAQPASTVIPPATISTPTTNGNDLANRNDLLSKIEDSQNQLTYISGTLRETTQRTLGMVREVYVRNGSQQEKDEAYRYTKPNIQRALDTRKELFLRRLPEIERERNEALRLLKLSESDFSSDEIAYNNALTNSLKEIPVPETWADAYFYSLNYSQMNDYLAGLRKRLSDLRH